MIPRCLILVMIGDRYQFWNKDNDGYTCVDIYDTILKIHLSTTGYIERMNMVLSDAPMTGFTRESVDAYLEGKIVLRCLNIEHDLYQREIISWLE